MNTIIETRKLYAAWYSLHHDTAISWRNVRLRSTWRSGRCYASTSIGDPYCTMFGRSLEGHSPREAYAAFRGFLARDIKSQRAMQAALHAYRARLEAAQATHPPRLFTQEEREFCNARDIEIGYDTDDERFCPTQLNHLVREDTALCNTPYLWFAGITFNSPRGDDLVHEEDNRITCSLCLMEFEKFRSETQGSTDPQSQGFRDLDSQVQDCRSAHLGE